MNTFTDTDLTVLEGLDFAPPCQGWPGEEDCTSAPQWLVVCHARCCGRVTTLIRCDAHHQRWLAWATDAVPAMHAACKAWMLRSDRIAIDRVEAL